MYNNRIVAQWAKAPGIHGYMRVRFPPSHPDTALYYQNNKMFLGAPKTNKIKKGFIITKVTPCIKYFQLTLDMNNFCAILKGQ